MAGVEVMQIKDTEVKNVLRILMMIWCVSIALIIIMSILCHVFADWARWFPVITEPEFIRFWIGKPIIVSLNVFLILSIIACLRVRTMKTAHSFIKRQKKQGNEEVPKDSAILDVYRRSVTVSIIAGTLMAVCGGIGFFLTRDYFVLYLFVFMGVTFLGINRPKQVEIEKVKEDMEAHASELASAPEKKSGIGRKIRFAFLMLLLFPVTCSYLEYRNVDPEGGCKGYENAGICLEAWTGHSYSFQLLPTDNEMIQRFRDHRQEFENMRKDADLVRQKKMRETGWRLRHATIVKGGEVFSCFPPDIYSEQEKYELCAGPFMYYSGNPDDRLLAFAFETDRTIYILGADYGWPHNSHEKGYVYFPIVPKIENGRVIGPINKDGSRRAWRLFDRLDGKWPADMKGWEYRLRQIEPQWFLYISKDHIGG